ncbi:hypothetical protein [Methylobacterium sp. JK268]
MSRPNGKPPIDRTAETAHPVPQPPVPSATAPAEAGPLPGGGFATPTVENEPPCLFVGGSGMSQVDLLEMALMFLLQISGSPVVVEKGALRTQVLSAERVAQLSDSARRFVTPVGEH